MVGFSKALVTVAIRPVVGYLVTLSVSVQLIFAVLVYLVENPHNPGLTSFFDSCYFVVTVTTGVGLGDIAPVTTAGRAISMLMMLAGTGIFVSFTAVLSGLIMEAELRQQGERKDSPSDPMSPRLPTG